MESKIYSKLEDIYNISVVLDTFCAVNIEKEEISNVYPLIRQIRKISDSIISEVLENIKSL